MRPRGFGVLAVGALVLSLPVAGTVVPGGSVAGAAGVVEVPTSIDATGRDDVTDALNQWIVDAPDGSTLRLAGGGRYRAEGTVFLEKKRDIVLDGNGATLFATTDGSGVSPDRRQVRGRWPRTRDHLRIKSSAGIEVADLTIAGPNPSGEYVVALEAQAAVLIARSERVELDGVTMRNVFGDGVYVTGGSRTIGIRNCTMDLIGRQGVAVVSGEQITVEGCDIRGVARSVIDLEPARGLARDVVVRDNRIGEYGNFLLAAVGALDGVGAVSLERNEIDGGRGVSVYAGTKRSLRSDLRIVDNVGTGISAGYEGVLMRVERFQGVEIRGNRQRVAAGVTPVFFLNSCSTTVLANEFAADGAEIRTEGDCQTPGLRVPPPRREARPLGPRPGAERRARRGAGGAGTRPGQTPPAPRVVVRTIEGGESGASPAVVWSAFAAGGVVGGIAVGLWFRSRSRRSDRGPSEQSDAPSPNAESAEAD